MEAVLQSRDAPWVVAVSLLPAFSPILMPMRIAVSAVAAWEIVAELVLLTLAAHLMRLAAGHAFRIGMLMYGKELTLPELVRWSKQV